MKRTILLEKDYHGFESFTDMIRDVEEVFDFPPGSKLDGEFEGTIRLKIEYLGDKDDE